MTERKAEAIEQLERMLNSGENLLTICSVKECGKIKIPLGEGEEVWLSRDDNHELYDAALLHYGDLRKLGKGGLSHGMCPEDGRKFYGDYLD